MTSRFRTSLKLVTAAALGAAAAVAVQQPSLRHLGWQAIAQTASTPRVAIQVSENDPKAMNLALNNAANLAAHYKAQGKTADIQIVTYGPGLHMLRADTSPVKSRIATMSLEIEGLRFAACANTRANMSKQEGAEVALVSEAKVVPSGVVTLLELQQSGYAYIRP